MWRVATVLLKEPATYHWLPSSYNLPPSKSDDLFTSRNRKGEIPKGSTRVNHLYWLHF